MAFARLIIPIALVVGLVASQQYIYKPGNVFQPDELYDPRCYTTLPKVNWIWSKTVMDLLRRERQIELEFIEFCISPESDAQPLVCREWLRPRKHDMHKAVEKFQKEGRPLTKRFF